MLKPWPTDFAGAAISVFVRLVSFEELTGAGFTAAERTGPGQSKIVSKFDAAAEETLRIGTITQRAAFTPKRQIWRRSALDWVDQLAAVPGTEKG